MAERTDPVVITLSCEANPAVETYEVDRAEWDAMTPGQRLALVEAALDEHVANAGGYGWSIADPDDEAAVGDQAPDPLRDLAEWIVKAHAESGWTGRELTVGEIITRAREALGSRYGGVTHD